MTKVNIDLIYLFSLKTNSTAIKIEKFSIYSIYSIYSEVLNILLGKSSLK